MIKEHKVTIGGVELTNVQSVSVDIETPADGRGVYREPTFAATVVIERNASDVCIVDIFRMATNEDGRKVMITSGALDFHSDDYEHDYSFEIMKAFVSSWELVNPEVPNAPTMERFELRVGELKFNADGGGAAFKLEDFK